MPPPAAPPGHGKGKTLLHGVGGRNPLLLLAGGGALVVVVVAMVHRSSGSAGGSTATTAANPTGTYDSSLADYENYFQDQLNNLATQIGNQNPTPTGGTTTPGNPAPSPVSQGAKPPVNVSSLPKPVPKPAPAPKPASQTQKVVTVVGGDTLSSIAAKFGETWQQVWAYNLKPGVRSAADEKTLKSRGANTLYRGEQIYIPVK